jgi:hypothetical protein
MSNEIQIVNFSNLIKIENFMLQNSQYLLSCKLASNFNTKISLERRMRTPFLDHQTGILQKQNLLFNNLKSRRMPGQFFSPKSPIILRYRTLYIYGPQIINFQVFAKDKFIHIPLRDGVKANDNISHVYKIYGHFVMLGRPLQSPPQLLL